MDQLNLLKEAKETYTKARNIVEGQMAQYATEGKLRQNGHCHGWGDYERALTALEKLREQFGA